MPEESEDDRIQSQVVVQTLETFFTPQWGEVTRLKVYTSDYRRLSWLQVWQAVSVIYPDQWAVELYPPASELINEAHVYHLWLMAEAWQPPTHMNLAENYRTE
jgi:hypothetical protein